MKPSPLRLLALVAALCGAGPAAAVVVTYDIHGTIAGSPLAGQTFGGHFSVELDGTGAPTGELSFLDLDFRFNGRSYDETAVPGKAVVTTRGELRTLFGPACGVPHPAFPGNIYCELPSDMDSWFVTGVDGAPGAAAVEFVLASTGATVYSADATMTLREQAPVPEPASAPLVIGALAGAVLARRRSGPGGR